MWVSIKDDAHQRRATAWKAAHEDQGRREGDVSDVGRCRDD